MGLYDFLHNLQQQPTHVRRRILVGMSILLFVGFAALWVGTLKNRLARQNPLSLTATGQEAQQDERPGPLTSIARGIAVTFSDLQEQTGAFLYKTEQIINPAPLSSTQPRQSSVHKLPVVEQ